MAVLNQLNIRAISQETNEHIIREHFAGLFWQWYDKNLELQLKTVRIWVFKKTLRVKDLKTVFEFLFGEHPGERPYASGKSTGI